MKIAEKVDESYQSPSVLELRYSGRKIVEYFDLVFTPSPLHNAEDKLKDAIYDCHRARHDATDHATHVIAKRLEIARQQFGADAIREVFSEYADLVLELQTVQAIITQSREKRNERGEFYSQIESGHLPNIMKLFNKFKVVEPDLENNYVKRTLKEWGVRYGWIAAIVISLLAWLYPRSP